VARGQDTGSHPGRQVGRNSLLPQRPGSQPSVTPLKGGVGTPSDKWDPETLASAREQGRRNNEIRENNESKSNDVERSNVASMDHYSMMSNSQAPSAGNTEDHADKVARLKGWSN